MFISVKPTGTVDVRYVKTHSHSLSFNQTKFLPLPQELREDITTMLSLNVPLNKILDTVRQSFGCRENRDNTTEMQHFHLIDRQALRNIKKRW